MKPPENLPHLERVLIICGLPNAGKSRLLRSMFVDPRFGTKGVVPRSKRIASVALSRERCLQLRCTSPHEVNETLEDFFTELNRARRAAKSEFMRFNYACALQPSPRNKAPSATDFCEEFVRRLIPERVRLVQIDPRQDGNAGAMLPFQEIDRLRAVNVEVVTIDGRRGPISHPDENGLLLADFFDFT